MEWGGIGRRKSGLPLADDIELNASSTVPMMRVISAFAAELALQRPGEPD